MSSSARYSPLAQQRPPMPVGFLLLGVVLAMLCASFTTLVVTVSGNDTVLRAVFAVVALLSAVLVEALWYVRPWVARAADAWAAVCCGLVLLPALAVVVDRGFIGALFGACFIVLPCAGVRWYVRDRARRLGLAPGRVP